MSRPLLFVALISLIQLLSSCCCWAVDKEVWEAIQHNVRIMRHRDGTHTEYRRSNDEKTLRKRRFSDSKGGRNAILTTTIYRMDKRGNPLSCKIFDGKENLLYKVAYGYHRKTGQLIAEDMYDARVPQKDPKTGKEAPVRRMYWFYDGAGNVTRAFSYVWRKGEYAEQKYAKSKDIETSFPTDNPFRNGSKAGTPAAPQSDEPFDEKEEFDVPPPLPPLPFER
ncbi:MAG: hypothetical protein ACSHYB_07525 [Roseibacillus sp.]